MGRRKNLTSVLVHGPGLVTIILMGLIVSVIIWHELKGHPTREKRGENSLDEPRVNVNQWSAEVERYRKWWRSPYENKKTVLKEGRPGIMTKPGGRRKKRPSTFNKRKSGGWIMEPEECVAWCKWCRMTQGRHKHIPLEKCTQLQIQKQDYRFLANQIPTPSSKGRQNMTDRPNILFTVVIIVLAGLIIGHQGLWKVKCQVIGTLIMIGIPPNQGDEQGAQRRNSQGSFSHIGTEHYNAIMAGIICALIGTVVLCVWLACGLKAARKYKRPDGIYLQIVTERLSETAYLGECLMPIDQVFQKNDVEPLVRELYVKHLFGTYLVQLVWGRQLYAIEKVASGRAINLSLPGSVNISRRMATALRDDPRTVRMARLLRYTGGLASVIPVGMPMISIAGWSVIGGKDLREQDFPEFRPPVVMRSRSHRGAKPPRGVRNRKKGQEGKPRRDTIEVIYEVPLTRSQESLARPLPFRPKGQELMAIADITPV